MPTEIYEVVAQGMRYWFLFLMALIVWRSYRWYRRDRKQRKKRLRLLPDAGYVGEMVVVDGGGALKNGSALPVPREGTLGFLRSNDLCVPVDGVGGKHLWFCFEDDDGLMVEPFGRKKTVAVDGERFVSRRKPLYMAHGSRLRVGEAELRLRLFAGFETAAGNRRGARAFDDEERDAQAARPLSPLMTPEQYAAYQRWMLQATPGQPGAKAAMTPEQYAAYQQQLWLQQQAAYQQWAWRSARAQGGYDAGDIGGAEAYGQDAYDDEDEPAAPGGVHQTPDGSLFATPEAYQRAAKPRVPAANEADEEDEADGEPAYRQTVLHGEDDFFPPVADDPSPYEDDLDAPDEDDMTDAALPPRSAYIGHDEAELAKKKVWDRYLGGGRRR